MKKSILNLGKALNKIEQKQIQGGKVTCCSDSPSCPNTNYVACIVTGSSCTILTGISPYTPPYC